RRDCMVNKRDEDSVSDPGKGDQTRDEIVSQALQIAAHKGLGALTIGTLAKKLKMSKSGLFVHFGSKEKLEAAVVERAGELFFSHVLLPPEEDGRRNRAGLDPLRSLARLRGKADIAGRLFLHRSILSVCATG